MILFEQDKPQTRLNPDQTNLTYCIHGVLDTQVLCRYIRLSEKQGLSLFLGYYLVLNFQKNHHSLKFLNKIADNHKYPLSW
jgi:hypothetical protein